MNALLEDLSRARAARSKGAALVNPLIVEIVDVLLMLDELPRADDVVEMVRVDVVDVNVLVDVVVTAVAHSGPSNPLEQLQLNPSGSCWFQMQSTVRHVAAALYNIVPSDVLVCEHCSRQS